MIAVVDVGKKKETRFGEPKSRRVPAMLSGGAYAKLGEIAELLNASRGEALETIIRSGVLTRLTAVGESGRSERQFTLTPSSYKEIVRTASRLDTSISEVIERAILSADLRIRPVKRRRLAVFLTPTSHDKLESLGPADEVIDRIVTAAHLNQLNTIVGTGRATPRKWGESKVQERYWIAPETHTLLAQFATALNASQSEVLEVLVRNYQGI